MDCSRTRVALPRCIYLDAARGDRIARHVDNANLLAEVFHLKKYIVFAYGRYFPLGGLSDIADSFDTLQEAIDFARESRADFTDIVDRDTWQILGATTHRGYDSSVKRRVGP